MKHPDDTDQAIEFMRRRAQRNISDGMSIDGALGEAVDFWEKSLVRMQLINSWQSDLRAQGKPTLHVSLFEAVKIR